LTFDDSVTMKVRLTLDDVDSALYFPMHNSASFLAVKQSRFRSRSIWTLYTPIHGRSYLRVFWQIYKPILNIRFVVTSDNKRSFMFPLTLVLSLRCKRRRIVPVSPFYFCTFVRWVIDTFLPRVLPWRQDYTRVRNYAMHAENPESSTRKFIARKWENGVKW